MELHGSFWQPSTIYEGFFTMLHWHETGSIGSIFLWIWANFLYDHLKNRNFRPPLSEKLWVHWAQVPEPPSGRFMNCCSGPGLQLTQPHSSSWHYSLLGLLFKIPQPILLLIYNRATALNVHSTAQCNDMHLYLFLKLIFLKYRNF